MTIRSILFVELIGGVGDVVIALPAIQALGRSHPEAQLTVLTVRPGGELLLTDPLVHRVAFAGAQPEQVVANLLADHAFDLVVADARYGGIPDLLEGSGAPWVIADLWRSPPPDQRVGDRFIEILQAEGAIAPGPIAPPRIHLTAAELDEARAAIGDQHPLVVLCPDVGVEIKRWPEEHFVALGRGLRRCGATTVLAVGGDRDRATRIAEHVGGATRVWPRGPLRRLAAALAAADLVVAADSGPAHVAAALDVPTIGLFGPSWHGRYGRPSPHVDLQGFPGCPERIVADLTRQRCWRDGMCPLDPWRTCMRAIEPEEVLAAALPHLTKWGRVGSSPGSRRSPRA